MGKPKVIIGSAHLHRPQRCERKDPAPFLPFHEEIETTVFSRMDTLLAFGFTALLIFVIAATAYYYVG